MKSGCECKCCCCDSCPSRHADGRDAVSVVGRRHNEVKARLHDAMIDKRVRNAIVLDDAEWRAYEGGLVPSAKYRDSLLWEAGVDSLMYQGEIVISAHEYGNWRARKRP